MTPPLPEQSIHQAANHEVETYTGRYVNLADPDPATICIEDIAHGLANTCRFGGHCWRFYSVAEHAVLVTDKLLSEGWTTWALAGLHHDDAEAYLGDIPRPLKPLLGDAYRKMTIDVDAAIHKALGEQWFIQDMHGAQVRAADEWMLAMEARELLPSRGVGWQLDPKWPTDGPCPVVDPLWGDNLGLSPLEAETAFLDRHWALVAIHGRKAA